MMERHTIIVNDPVVRSDDLPNEYRLAEAPRKTIPFPLGETLGYMEEMVIRRTLAEITPHRERAAGILGISPRALHYKLRRLGIDGETGNHTPPSE